MEGGAYTHESIGTCEVVYRCNAWTSVTPLYYVYNGAGQVEA